MKKVNVRGICFVAVLFLFVQLAVAQERTTIAVLDFEGFNISNEHVQGLTNRLRSLLVMSREYQVLERGRMDEILEEQGFQQSGCTSEECLVEAGQLLGVEKMLTGSYGLIGSTYTIDMRIIDVASGQITQSASHDMQGEIDDVLRVGLQETLDILQGYKKSEIQLHRTAALRVNSQPRGAEVLVAGESYGRTPLKIPELPINMPLEVSIRKDGFVTRQRQISLAVDQENVIDVELERQMGRLTVLAEPVEGMVRLDGVKLGRTPFEDYELPVGLYPLEVVSPEFKIYRDSIRISYHQLQQVESILQPLPKSTALLFSALLPGAGQLYQKRPVRSAICFGTGLCCGLLTYSAHSSYLDAKDDWRAKRDLYNQNQSQPQLWDAQQQAAEQAFDDMKSYEQQRTLFGAALGLVWTVNIIDILF